MLWVIAAVIFPVVFALNMYVADDARAQAFPSFTCAQLDPAQGGAPFDTTSDVNLTVALGDQITIINPIGPGLDVIFTPPGAGAPIFAPSPAVINVGPGQVGVFVIGSFLTVSCTAAPPPVDPDPTPRQKSETTDGLFSTFVRTDRSILDSIEIPTAVPRTYKPANDRPLKFAPSVATPNVYRETFGLQSEPPGLAVLGDRRASDSFQFSFDLKSMMAKPNANDASGFDGMGNGEAAYHGPWNGWVSGRYIDFDDDDVGADRDGHQWSVVSGISYLSAGGASFGAFARVREGEVDSNALNAKLDSDFYGGGAFVSAPLAGGVNLTGAALYETGDNDISIQGATGSFDSDQWTLEGRIDKRIVRGRYWIVPALGLLYTNVDRDSYTDSTGAFVAGSELELGRFTYGPKIGTTIQRQNAQVKPFMRINGVWDFVNEGDYLVAGGAVISDASTAINLGGGVEVAFLGGMVLSVGGDWYGFEDDLDSWSVTGAAALPLSALGFGNTAAGLVSFDLAASPDGGSAKARIRIPLGGKSE